LFSWKGTGVIVFAIASELELRRLRRLIDPGRVEVHGARKFFFGIMCGRDVCLVRTGAGRKNAAAAARHICSVVRPELVIIAGAAGALDSGLGLGATVVVESIIREDNHLEISCPAEWSRRALALLSAGGMQACAGRCCQVRTFMHRAAEKQALYERTHAHVVDMESAAFGYEFQRAGVPFVNIRIVSDTARRDTADMETLLWKRYRQGRIAAGLHLLRHPRELVRTRLFYRGMAIADRCIAEAVSTLVDAHDRS
jgi:adenosylhomocysteine nucleosidase